MSASLCRLFRLPVSVQTSPVDNSANSSRPLSQVKSSSQTVLTVDMFNALKEDMFKQINQTPQAVTAIANGSETNDHVHDHVEPDGCFDR